MMKMRQVYAVSVLLALVVFNIPQAVPAEEETALEFELSRSDRAKVVSQAGLFREGATTETRDGEGRMLSVASWDLVRDSKGLHPALRSTILYLRESDGKVTGERIEVVSDQPVTIASGRRFTFNLRNFEAKDGGGTVRIHDGRLMLRNFAEVEWE